MKPPKIRSVKITDSKGKMLIKICHDKTYLVDYLNTVGDFVVEIRDDANRKVIIPCLRD